MMNRKKEIFKNLKNVAKVIVSLLLVIWLLRQIDLKKLYFVLRSGSLPLLITGSVLLFLSTIITQSARLHVLIRRYTLSYWRTCKLLFISMFFNMFLPTSVGGDGYKVIFLKGVGIDNWGKPFILVFLERFIGLLVLLGIGFFYFIINYKNLIIRLHDNNLEIQFNTWILRFAIAFVFFIIVAIFTIFSIRNRKNSFIARTFNRLKVFLKDCKTTLKEMDKSVYLSVLAITFIFHLLRAFGFYFWILYFDEKILVIDILFVMSFTAFVSLVPMSLGALGVREGAAAFGFIIFGLSKSNAITIAFMDRILLILYAVIGGIIFLLRKRSDGGFSEKSKIPS
ncbi:flippase-like domain-containing protein [Candidatus Poribacteria bacterium]|nr:flippase-like domain-containing protein [Candidatus Poribacteria bacterium]